MACRCLVHHDQGPTHEWSGHSSYIYWRNETVKEYKPLWKYGKSELCLLNIRRILLYFECENGRSLTTVVLCYLLQTINYSDGFHLHEAYSSPLPILSLGRSGNLGWQLNGQIFVVEFSHLSKGETSIVVCLIWPRESIVSIDSVAARFKLYHFASERKCSVK